MESYGRNKPAGDNGVNAIPPSNLSVDFLTSANRQVPGLGFPAARTERDPNGLSLNAPGAKADAGKLRPTLIFKDMARALEAVIKIATDGAAKYTAGGWLVVPKGEERYEDADLRHMLKRFKGEAVDADSQGLHLAHEAWNALAKLELHLRSQERSVS